MQRHESHSCMNIQTNLFDVPTLQHIFTPTSMHFTNALTPTTGGYVCLLPRSLELAPTHYGELADIHHTHFIFLHGTPPTLYNHLRFTIPLGLAPAQPAPSVIHKVCLAHTSQSSSFRNEPFTLMQT